MTKPKAGGYTHRWLVKRARRATAKACSQLRAAIEAETVQAQAMQLAHCSLALAETTSALAEIQALLDDVEGAG